jgi:hypothetical protein
MISAWSIRKFLMRQPRAVVIRLQSGSAITEMRPARTGSLAKLADTIFAVAPEVIQLFDAEDHLLRAQRTDVEPDLSTDSPKPPQVLSSDPETARVSHFATLLAKAYEHATNVAFQKLVDLVERIDQRTDALEQRLERTEGAYRKVLYDQLADAQTEAMAALRDAQAGDDTEADMFKAMAGQVLQGMARAQAEGRHRPPAPEKSGNGKAGG